jgi:replication factor A1
LGGILIPNEIDSYIDDILTALQDNTDMQVTREDIENELKRFIEYGVPLEHAKQTLLKKYSRSYSPQSSERTLLTDLKPGKNNVHVLSRIVYINDKQITVKGENKTIFYGILGDESGTLPFTAWADLELEKGDVVDITNAYTKEWQGETQLNLGDRTKIEKKQDSDLPKITFEPKNITIKDLRSGIGTVEVTARILELNQREVNVNGTKKTVFSGILADETGTAQYTSWHDFKIKEGDVLKISGGYVKTWRGIPQLTFDEKASVEKLKSSIIPKEKITSFHLLMHELLEKKGAMDVTIQGSILEIQKGSGFIMRCPECNRRLQDDQCSIHGTVSGVEDLRMKLVVDDGTGVVSAILDKQLTETILDKSYNELKKIYNSEGEDSLLEYMNQQLFTQNLEIRGNALHDDFGITFIVKEATLKHYDTQLQAEKITQEMEDNL